MAQRVKVLTTEPDDLSSITETHMGEEESQLLKVVTSTHRGYGMSMHSYTQINVINKSFLKRRED